MSALQSWATLAIALAFPLAILRVLWLLTHPTRTCAYCDKGFRGRVHYVLDDHFHPLASCCSAACADNLNESLWLGQNRGY